MDRLYYFDLDGQKIPVLEAMVAKLLDDEVLFVSASESKTLELFVICNDVFAWGCADGEDILPDEIPNLFERVEKYGTIGAVHWCCAKRGEKPQPPLEKMMRDKGEWTEELELLKTNSYFLRCQELQKTLDAEKAS